MNMNGKGQFNSIYQISLSSALSSPPPSTICVGNGNPQIKKKEKKESLLRDFLDTQFLCCFFYLKEPSPSHMRWRVCVSYVGGGEDGGGGVIVFFSVGVVAGNVFHSCRPALVPINSG